MRGSVLDFPPGMEIPSWPLVTTPDMANRPDSPSVADVPVRRSTRRSVQPNNVAEPMAGNLQVRKLCIVSAKNHFANRSKAGSTQHPEVEGESGATDGSGGSSNDSDGTGDGVVFHLFQLLPGEIKTMIWIAAAEAAKPQGVYQFKVENVQLGLRRATYQAAPALTNSLRRVSHSSILRDDVFTLMHSVYSEDTVTSFTPLPEVGRFTREARDLLRSCPEARSELLRMPDFQQAFRFHWLTADGKCDLGIARPFCYDTDWLSLRGLREWPTVRPAGHGTVCTGDLVRIQHVAIPLSTISPLDRAIVHLQTLPVFPRLRSLGIYDPEVSVRSADRWARRLAQDQKLFLKGVSVVEAGTAPQRERYVSGCDFWLTMEQLKDVIRMIAVRAFFATWAAQDEGRTIDFGGLQFCVLLHATSQEGLDLMEFREDGSHLDGIERIEELGDVGQEIKRLRRSVGFEGN